MTEITHSAKINLTVAPTE